jgi:hypothetical protein
VQWHSLLSRGSRRLSWYCTLPQWQLASYLTSKSSLFSCTRYGGRCFHSEIPVVESPRLWSLSILKAEWLNVGCCRVRCDTNCRARGSADDCENNGRRRSAIEDTDMKLNVGRIGVIEYRYLFAAIIDVLMWSSVTDFRPDVTMIMSSHHRLSLTGTDPISSRDSVSTTTRCAQIQGPHCASNAVLLVAYAVSS